MSAANPARIAYSCLSGRVAGLTIISMNLFTIQIDKDQPNLLLPKRFAHIFFMDGVGLGVADPEINPCTAAETPNLDQLFGPDWFVVAETPKHAEKATLVATDATLGVEGRPQSATGQATILSGRNIPQAVGEHYGPKPNQAIRDEIMKGTLFKEVKGQGGTAALLSPYPPPYFAAIQSGKRLYSAVPQAVVSGGYPLFGPEEMANGEAVSPDFTGEAWRSMLGYPNSPLYSLPASGRKIAELAEKYTFSFFEHWPSDRLGHRGPIDAAIEHISVLDTVIGSLIDAWSPTQGLLVITSDHGNIEDKSHRLHTRNPVPTIICAQNHRSIAAKIKDLTDIAAVIRSHLFAFS